MPQSEATDSSDVSGPPISVMLTAYSTTLFTDCKTRLRVALTDSLNREIPGATDSIRVYVTGAGTVTAADESSLTMHTDTAGLVYAAVQLKDGVCNLTFTAGSEPANVKVEARADSLWPGAHEIHVLDSFRYMTPTPEQLAPTTKSIDNMIGADISWLPQLEDRGDKFFEDSAEIDAMALLKKHGFNYIRLRVFVNPEHEKGYAPDRGYCGLPYTLAMAKRVQDAGMKLLLDFHYSDYWADPQQQYKPARWQDLDFETLQDSVSSYTTNVLDALAAQGTPAAMVQIGNEINHGFLWPEGHIGNPDQLAALLKAGVSAAKAADPNLPIMMHIALGGQNAESVFWLDNMFARGVTCDIIGLSYYPRWHGTPTDLKANMLDLIDRYHKPLNVVEYSDFKREVHDLVFSLPDRMGKGACIWEPLNLRSGLFDSDGNVTGLMGVYDEIEAEAEEMRKSRK
jgi:beta-galactosidase